MVGIERPLKSPKYTRHTSATILAGLGWSSKDIADHLGHKNDRVTREYYIQSQSKIREEWQMSLDIPTRIDLLERICLSCFEPRGRSFHLFKIDL